MTEPPRGFPEAEFRDRCIRIQTMMRAAGLDALLLTTEPDVRYVTGFLTRFWESPTRPWFVVVPQSGDPIAVIPSIGAHLMGQCWISDIRPWRSPDYSDDGVSLLRATLTDCTPAQGRIGVPSGLETHLRMPLDDWAALQAALAPRTVAPDAQIMRRARAVKSPAEIAKIRHACEIAGRSFARVPACAAQGQPLEAVFRRVQRLALEEGADWVAYLAGGAGPGGYGDVISPASARPLEPGDVLMLDTGVVWDGYFCDFDRNYGVGPPDAETEAAYQLLLEAEAAGFAAARPGATAAELFAVMDACLTGGEGGSDAGRLGHGVGLQLTEGLSLMPQDHTVLEAGMVITLEPGIEIAPGRTLVHEEVITITESGADYLSTPAPRHLPRLGA